MQVEGNLPWFWLRWRCRCWRLSQTFWSFKSVGTPWLRLAEAARLVFSEFIRRPGCGLWFGQLKMVSETAARMRQCLIRPTPWLWLRQGQMTQVWPSHQFLVHLGPDYWLILHFYALCFESPQRLHRSEKKHWDRNWQGHLLVVIALGQEALLHRVGCWLEEQGLFVLKIILFLLGYLLGQLT